MLVINKKNIKKISWILRFTTYQKGNILIAKKSNISTNTKIADGTRINGKIVIKGHAPVKIGYYCAIGDGVRIISSNHATNYMNLQYALQVRIGSNKQVAKKQGVVVGHNVWIGDTAIILPGVNIGNGAVIASASVVTKDVPAYAIVGGNPAKVIRYRFNENSRKICETHSWWEWSEDKMRTNSELFNEVLN